MDKREFREFEERIKQFLYRCPDEIIKSDERLKEKIGEGGFGVVYSIEGSRDCIKFSKMDDQIYYRNKRGLSNQIALQKVTDNVVKIKGVYEDSNYHMYAIRMERLINLRTFVNDNIGDWNLVPVDFIIQVGVSVVDVIQRMRKMKAVHLDIKLDNLFVRVQENKVEIVLGDFEAGNIEYEGTHTPGTKVPIYSEDVVAPEILTSQSGMYPCNHFCDQYSLGTTLYALLNGGQYIKTMVWFRLYPDLPKLDRCPNGLFEIIKRMMALDPEKRYQDYSNLQRDLLRVRNDIRGNIVRKEERDDFTASKSNNYQDDGNIHYNRATRIGDKRIVARVVVVFVLFGILYHCLFSGMDGRTNDTNSRYNATRNEEYDYETIDVPRVENKELLVDTLTTDMSSEGNAEILVYNGNISNEDQIDVYTFVASHDGRYRVDLTNIQNETNMELYILDEYENILYSDTYCVNGEGITGQELQAGKTYTVKVKQREGYTSYTMAIGFQKDVTDITGKTKITDSMEYLDQRNIYKFTVPLDGCYRFWISGLHNGKVVRLYICNQLGEIVDSDTYCINEDGLTIRDMKAGEIYEIQIEQAEGFCEYALEIGYQKQTVDLLDYSIVKDSIEYTDQRNVYTFSVPTDGRYRFEISGMIKETNVGMYVLNQLGEDVKSDTFCVNGDGVTLDDLKAGEVYELQVRQVQGYGDYAISIDRQKETIKVNERNIIQDSVEYNGQINVYSFEAQTEGMIKITMTGLNSGVDVELGVYNDLGEEIDGDSYCVNGDYIEIQNEKKGTHYIIQVKQSEGISDYVLTIN